MRLILSASALAVSLAFQANAAAAAPAAVLPPVPAAAAPHAVTTQLPRSVRPTHYAVWITPDAAASRFDGRVVIDITVVEPTARITLNAADLHFQQVALRAVDGARQVLTGSATVDAPNQTASFDFPQPVAPGRYQLDLSYGGVIGTQPVGLFSLDYDNAGGHQRALYTQFENSDARRMIPSWDEPGYKATFSLQAVAPAGQLAVSNTPIQRSTKLADGRFAVEFQPTPKMSTYLLFFGLGDFERATKTVDGTELGVVTQRGALSQARFALDASGAILQEYNDYFGVRFPLPKLDNVAAPGRSQFFGAMENWGAIFTFEHAILLDPTISTQSDKERAFAIAAHEMAHQWFGDLVTMQWWDDLWLNEGFASWMESRTTARLHPEWQTALRAVSVREDAMNRDSLATTHPVVQHVATVEQASQAFDSITYEKGESVIRMLESYVGADTWRAGVRAYMLAHAYGNTATDDLWREIETAAGKPITAIAHDFTLQPGVPMIRVEDATCRGGKSVIQLTQGEFSRDQPNKAPLAWRVPVSIRIGADASGATAAKNAAARASTSALVEGGKATVTVPGCGPVLVNAGQTGYYRTVYARPLFKMLSSRFASLAPIDQLGLLSDSWALGLTGQQPAADFLDLANAVPLNAEPRVWSVIAGNFDALHGYYKPTPRRQAQFDRYAISRLAPELAHIGWAPAANEPETIAPLREKLIGALSELGDAGTIAEARRRYAARDTDPAAVPAPLRKIILAVVASHADAATWDALRRAAQAEKSPMIKNDLYDLLATTQDQTLAQRALTLALTDEPGVTNSAAMLAHVAGEYPDLAFDFALSHLAQVNERVDATSRSRYFPGLASGSADPAMVDKIHAYAQNNLAAGSRREADTAAARIRDRLRIQAQRLPEIDAWLAQHAG